MLLWHAQMKAGEAARDIAVAWTQANARNLETMMTAWSSLAGAAVGAADTPGRSRSWYREPTPDPIAAGMSLWLAPWQQVFGRPTWPQMPFMLGVGLGVGLWPQAALPLMPMLSASPQWGWPSPLPGFAAPMASPAAMQALWEPWLRAMCAFAAASSAPRSSPSPAPWPFTPAPFATAMPVAETPFSAYRSDGGHAVAQIVIMSEEGSRALAASTGAALTAVLALAQWWLSTTRVPGGWRH